MDRSNLPPFSARVFYALILIQNLYHKIKQVLQFNTNENTENFKACYFQNLGGNTIQVALFESA